MDTKWTKTNNWSQYQTTLPDGTTVTVSKYFPGENWWDGQNYYWAWEIEHTTDKGNGPKRYTHTPNGEYQRTMADCKTQGLAEAAKVTA